MGDAGSQHRRFAEVRRGLGPVSMWALLVGVLLAAAVASPWVFAGLGTGRIPVLAGIMAWRALVTACLWALAVVLAVAGAGRAARRVAVGLLIPAVALACLASGTLLASGRAVAPGTPGVRRQLSIMSWNINGSLVDAGTVARLALASDPDVLVLPEIADGPRDRLAVVLGQHGYRLIHARGSQTAIFTTAGYRPAGLHEYGADEDREAVAEGASGLPRLIAVHLPIPVAPRGNRAWNREIDWLGGLCRSDIPTVIVGDLNATDDNLAGTGVARCSDAAGLTGRRYSGTWPTGVPSGLGIAIDHVLVAGPGIEVNRFTVVRGQDASGARHRPVQATVAIRGPR